MLVTFSGLDGAGKTTVIGKVRNNLEKQGVRISVMTMYDHVGLYAFVRGVRNRFNEAKQKSEQNEGSHHLHPAKEKKRYYIITSYLLPMIRSNRLKKWVYLFDLFTFWVYFLYFCKLKSGILFMDRYFYDSLADVADGKRWYYIRIFLHITPSPDLAFFIDVDPEKAFNRKGEYSVDHLKSRRLTYKSIFQWAKPIWIKNDDLDLTVSQISSLVSGKVDRR